MIYMKLKFYLRENLPIASPNFKWTQDHNKKLFDFLYENYSYDYIYKVKNKSEIKQAFIDFFEPVGYIIFHFKENKINFKLIPYNIDPANSRHLSVLVDMIKDNDDLVTYDYKGKDNQIAIEYKLRRDIYRYVEHIDDERVNRQELIKYATREALELLNNDIVLKKKKLIFVKLLSTTNRTEVDKDNDSELNRFNGYSEDELQDLLEEYFDEATLNTFLNSIAKKVFRELFMVKQVTNETYEKIIFPYVQNIIATEVLEITNKDLEFGKGFAGYIFRINFIDVFQFMAYELLKQIYAKNTYTISWLKYYNGQVFIDKNKRYIAQELISQDNNRWNPVAIHSNITAWFKTQERMLMYKKKILLMDEKLSTMLIDNKTPIEYKKILQDDYDEMQRAIEEINLELQEVIEKKQASTDTNVKAELSLSIKDLRDELKGYKQDKEEISDSINKINTFHVFKKLEEEKNKYLKDLQRESKVLSESKERYLSIESAIVKALISKRKAM